MGLLVVVAFALGAASQSTGCYAPLAANLGVIQNPRFAAASAWQRSRLPVLYLDVRFQDVQQLEAQRQGAALSGVHISTPGEAVSATVRISDQMIPVQVRLPQGAVEPGQWRFDVSALDEHLVLGWRHLRLSGLSLSQWGLIENLRREGIMASPIQLVRVVLNGDELGVYGAWAAMGTDPAGGMAYFDQTLYWRELQRQRGSIPPTSADLSACQAAVVRAVQDSPTEDLSGQAVALLRALQSGSRAPSDVLDVERMGMLLALVTLWRDAPLDDWMRLGFCLNPATGRMEPVVTGDSISVQIGGPLRWPICFDDPFLQAAFTQALGKISQPAYLDWLQTDLAFDQAQLVLASSGKPELTRNDLATRQERLARWLEPTQMVLATWTAPAAAPDATAPITLTNLARAPVEVLGLDIGESTFLPVDPTWAKDDARASMVVQNANSAGIVLRAAGDGRLCALRLDVPYSRMFAAGRAPDEFEVRVVTRLWGLEQRQTTLVRREER